MKAKRLSRKRVTTFLKDADDEDNVLPRPLPRGLTYVANFSSYEELQAANILTIDPDQKVHLLAENVAALFRAKCDDQKLQPCWEREARFLELVSQHCTGTRFILKENGLGTLSAQAIAQVLSNNNFYSIVDLSGNRLRDEGAIHLANLLAHNTAIVQLILKSNDIGFVGGEALARALAGNNTLTALDFSGVTGVNRNHLGTKGAAAFGKVLRANRILSILNLGANGLGKEGMALLAEGLKENSSVTDLDLCSNNLGYEGCQVLARLLSGENCAIEVLNLERNRIGDKGASLISQALKPPSKAAFTVQKLDLGTNNIKAIGFKYCADALRANKTLTWLRCDGNLPGTEGAVDMSIGFMENKCLEYLGLSHGEVGPEAGQAIGDALSNNTTMTKIDLSHNELSDVGASAICLALGKEDDGSPLPGLIHLDLTANKVGDDGGVQVANMLRTNTNLQTLLLKQNHIKFAGEHMAQALRSNTTLRHMDVSFNEVSYKAFSGIQSSLDRNTRLFKASAADRLNAQISGLRRDEELLMQTQESIEDELKARETAKDKVRQKRENLKKTVSGLKSSLLELEAELEEKRKARHIEEEEASAMNEQVQRFRINADKQTTQLTRKIELEGERMQKLTRQLQTMQKQIKQLQDSETEVFEPARRQLKEEEEARDLAKEDAKWEAEKLVEWELKLLELERSMSTDPAAANAVAGKAKATKKKKGKK
eukprot:NODE_204_length_2484_cov_82.404517_g157_i0.p1 GENE.NODE_204_length_2484_cov_82.404517_g157_i0~~NODE_204_length_2484_cov_82.404517_g157_i0.p1  ORF type:complete len:783 (+),score=238.50 NODE_204_length_2484_cov_82.404517_g157_i0:208-2349(+)